MFKLTHLFMSDIAHKQPSLLGMTRSLDIEDGHTSTSDTVTPDTHTLESPESNEAVSCN